MVKKEISAEKEIKTPKKHGFKRLFVEIAVVALVAGAGYGIWKNPQIWQQIKTMFGREDVYQQQIERLNRRLGKLQQQLTEVSAQVKQPDLTEFAAQVKRVENKIAAVESMNLNVIKSKADTATVLGVVTRMDKAEHRLDKLTEADNHSALVLTGVMLVKDSAERGGNFEYEAEVLSNIAADNPKYKNDVAKISSFASRGIIGERQLVKQFEEIYAVLLKEQKSDFDKTWKERLNSKLSEIVQIKKTNAEAPQFEADKGLEEVAAQVEKGHLLAAADLLEQSQHAELLKKKELQDWVVQVKNRADFYDAVRHISATALAALKVNFLKK